jgi:two-component system nitrate/nitrite response regulator NarL
LSSNSAYQKATVRRRQWWFKVNSSGLSLIIADDHPLMRAGIKEVLSADRLYNLTAVAQTGAECLELIQRLRPDVALIDIDISHPGAARILRELKVNCWQTRICFLTEGQIPAGVLEAGKNRDVAFVNGRLPEDLRDKLREIATDLTSQARAANGVGTIQRPISARTNPKRPLTFRQNQIVTMLKIGSSNREIARVLGLSEGTVKVHLHRIFQRIGVANRTQLAAHPLAGAQAALPNLSPGEIRKI